MPRNGVKIDSDGLDFVKVGQEEQSHGMINSIPSLDTSSHPRLSESASPDERSIDGSPWQNSRDPERLHRGLQIAQKIKLSHDLDGSFTNSKPKCLPLNLPNFKKNKPSQRLHFPSQINQLWARKNGKTRKIGCPWPLCGCSRIYHGSEATLHVRSP